MQSRLRSLLSPALLALAAAAIVVVQLPVASQPAVADAPDTEETLPAQPGIPERKVPFELRPPKAPDDRMSTQADDWPAWYPTSTAPVTLPCLGDGKNGARVQFWYAYVAGQPNRVAEARPWLTEQIERANGMVVTSAAKTNGFRALRVVTDANCKPSISAVQVSSSALSTLDATVSAMKAAGIKDSKDRVHVVLMDANGFSDGACGRGAMFLDENPDPTKNQHNLNGSWARIDLACWYAGGILHEIFHTFGAVQLGAPNADNMHCKDEGDLLCYGANTRMVCTGAVAEERLDCNNDDYFHTNPPAGSYLRNHWNTADSKYLSSDTAPRLAGADRYATAAAVSRKFAPGVATAYVATGASYADALSGAALAGRTGGPVLLTQATYTPTAVKTELTRLKPRKIVVLGGTTSVSNAVLNELRTFATANTSDEVTRLAGTDRYGTSAAVAATYPAGVRVAYVAYGGDFPDALAGAAVAGRDDAPVLLTRHDGLTAPVRQQLQRLRPQQIVLLGGTQAVSEAVEAELRTLATGTGTDRVKRIAGKDRYAVAAALAATYPAGSPTAYVASGATFPDALAGAALAGAEGAPVLLTQPRSVPAATSEALARLHPGAVTVLGGKNTVTDAVAGHVRLIVQ